MTKILPCKFPAVPLRFQILLGLACGFLDFAAARLRELLGIPLYLDTIFTMFASFFGLAGGLISGAVYHVVLAIAGLLSSSGSFYPEHLLWMICSLTIPIVFRLFMRRGKDVSWTDMLFILIIISVLIAFEGGIIARVLYGATGNYQEPPELTPSYFPLIIAGIKYELAVFLVRLPASLIDKTISLAVSFALCLGAQKVLRRKTARAEIEE